MDDVKPMTAEEWREQLQKAKGWNEVNQICHLIRLSECGRVTKALEQREQFLKIMERSASSHILNDSSNPSFILPLPKSRGGGWRLQWQCSFVKEYAELEDALAAADALEKQDG